MYLFAVIALLTGAFLSCTVPGIQYISTAYQVPYSIQYNTSTQQVALRGHVTHWCLLCSREKYMVHLIFGGWIFAGMIRHCSTR